MKKVILIVLLILLIGGGAYFVLGQKRMASPLPSQPDIKVMFPEKKKTLILPTVAKAASTESSGEPKEASPTAVKEEEEEPTITKKTTPTVKPTVKASPTGSRE